MVVLGIDPSSGLNDLGGDLRAVGIKVFLLYLLGHPLCDIFLSGRVMEDGRPILWKVVGLKTDDNDCREIRLRVPRSFPCLLRVVGSCVR